MGLNVWIVGGNLTREPEMSYTPSGLAVTKFTVAMDQWSSKDKANKTIFVNVVVFGQRAETCATWLKKGSQVEVVGEYNEDNYTDKDNVNRKWISLVARDVNFVARFKSKDEVHGYEPGAGGGGEPIEYKEGERVF